MAARKRRAAKAGPKCKMVATPSGKKTKRCWSAKGKFIKTPGVTRKRRRKAA